MNECRMARSFRLSRSLRPSKPLSSAIKRWHLCSNSHSHSLPPGDKLRVTSDKFEASLRLITHHSSLITHHFLTVKSLLTRFPFSLTQSASLQRLNNSKRFLSRTSDVEIVNHLVTQGALRIDNEETAKRDTAIFNQHAIVARDILSCIRGQRIYESFHATLVARRLDPGTMRIHRVSRDAYDVCADALKLFVTIAESRQLRGTNKSEVQRIEQEHHPPAVVIFQLYVFIQLLDIFG